MHVHVLGICGTFMGGIAALAKELGFKVSGCDLNVYPPMSDQLKTLGVELFEGYDPKWLLKTNPDVVVVGNALSRGNPMIESLLNQSFVLESGPSWLYRHVLKNKWVMAVAGTHGKTTTSSMLAWVLEHAGLSPGFLIGGVPAQFESSARLGKLPFVVEADEYDTAFFDKRSKFVHYWPKTCILNNLEFDHADIFKDLSEIQKQFHHLVRMVPQSGKIIYPTDDVAIDEVLAKGCWSMKEQFGLHQGQWQAKLLEADGHQFEVLHLGEKVGEVCWDLIGHHNVMNGLASVAAAHHIEVDPEQACRALSLFKAPKRRLEVIHKDFITLYDDFAHHPTAIRSTLEGLRARVPNKKIGVLLDLRSNTMKLGTHQHELYQALAAADQVGIFQGSEITWPVQETLEKREGIKVFQELDNLENWFKAQVQQGEHWIIMSNGAFSGLHQTIKNWLIKEKGHAPAST